MADLFGIEVVEDPYIPEGTFYALVGKNPIDLPPEWDAMTEMEKLSYLVAHGAIVAVHNVGTFKALIEKAPDRTSAGQK